jgi:hypothetical protein
MFLIIFFSFLVHFFGLHKFSAGLSEILSARKADIKHKKGFAQICS